MLSLATARIEDLESQLDTVAAISPRADAVRDYLVSKGVDKAKIETIGLGEKQPVVQCDQKNFKELVACLQPNRRVDVEVKGEAKK